MDFSMIEWGFGMALAGIVGAIGWQAKTVITNGHRVARLEARLDAFNIHAEITAIHQRVDDAAKTGAHVSGQLEQMNRTLEVIHRSMMERGHE